MNGEKKFLVTLTTMILCWLSFALGWQLAFKNLEYALPFAVVFGALLLVNTAAVWSD